MPPTSGLKTSASTRIVLFTTATFICLFLPVVLTGFFGLARWSELAAATWLFLASVFFYGYWMPQFTLLLLASILGNFFIGKAIGSAGDASSSGQQGPSRHWLVVGVVGNLVLLGYFKYANFFIETINTTLGARWTMGHVVLPIGISFFTFTQIAYLVDTWRQGIREYRLVHYGLFVTYFPHLIAGPILHHAQMMPQFRDTSTYRFSPANFATGAVIFTLGMMKKVLMADGISPYADAVFKAADSGVIPDVQEAWLGALAYTFQLYFDFSGYSDMAIGLSWMFNIRLPFNFNAPYRATNISDFWRRWHISLSQFLRDYLYIALGGNRKGSARRHTNLLLTMVLGGLWHGASWSFVFWGLLHGLYLGLNHGFRALCGPRLLTRLGDRCLYQAVAWLLTLLSVIVAWVLFRAETLPGAVRMLQGMTTLPVNMQVHILLWNEGLHLANGFIGCALLGAAALLGPTSNQIGDFLRVRLQQRPPPSAILTGASTATLAALLLINSLRDSVSAFIYFNF